MVKALEWRKLSFPIQSEGARTAFGDYRVGPTNDDRGWYALPEWKSHIGPFASCDEAKAAAQADFNQRILSALTRPSSPEVTDEMGRALVAKYREIWPGAGWPSLEVAKELIAAAIAKAETPLDHALELK